MILIIILSLASILGYTTFMVHPENLAKYPGAPQFFAISMPLFSQSLILIAFVVMALECQKSFGSKWLKFFVAAFGISLSMELAGTIYGIPFGKYAYTSLLGYKILDRVPLLIPLSWFFMAMPCFCLADWILGYRSNKVYRVLLAAVLLVTWDFTLDPAMSHLTPFWVWENPGLSILNIPLTNFCGWFFTGVLIFSVFEYLKVHTPERWIKNSFPLKFYFANLVLPLGLAMAGAVWLPIIATAMVFLICGAIAKSNSLRPSFGSR